MSIECDRAQGDRPGGRFTRSDTLFGMRRADLAPAGLFAGLSRTNIETVGVRIEAQPDRRTDTFAAAGELWSADRTDAF